jgi:GTP-dependent phosphoenolpyruvate carboxykinase
VELLGVDHEEWQKELAGHEQFFASLRGVVPQELLEERAKLVERFKN